jgi:hypothetical protein
LPCGTIQLTLHEDSLASKRTVELVHRDSVPDEAEVGLPSCLMSMTPG